jgi:ADP-ribosylation factor protein 1
LWNHYYQNSNALIFVVDSNDAERFEEARKELYGILSSEYLNGIPVLIFANKCDLPGSASSAKIIEALQLHTLRDHRWYVQQASAVTSDGLYEGLEWLSREFKLGN